MEERDKDLDWQIGDVRTAVAKRKRRDEGLVTYAPGGKVVVLHNETGRKLSEKDLIEIYIMEEKSRSYHAQVLKIIKKYAEIKKIARKRGEQFEERYQKLFEERTSPETVMEVLDALSEDVKKELETLKEDMGVVGSLLKEISENGVATKKQEEVETEEEEEEKPESLIDLVPVEDEAGVVKDKNSYVLVVRDMDLRGLLGEWHDKVLLDIYTSGDRDVPPLIMTKEPWNDGRIRVPVPLRDNFHHLYEEGNDIPVTVKTPQST